MFRPSRRRFLKGLAATSLVAAALSPPTAALATTEPAFPELSDGGFVIYFRHGATTWSGVDRLEWPRERQRLLSEEGIRQSQQIGAAFRERDIPVGEVLASPFARCRDMAEIAFGRVEERNELIGLLSDQEGRSERIAYLSRKVTQMPSPGSNRIIVAHRSNIASVADVRLAEGDGVVLRPDGNGGFTVLGIVKPGEWLP